MMMTSKCKDIRGVGREQERNLTIRKTCKRDRILVPIHSNRIPTGFHRSAQGCAERATLGGNAKNIFLPRRSCGKDPTPLRLESILESITQGRPLSRPTLG